MNDASLITRSLTQPETFAEIFDRHWHRIVTFCISRAGSAGEDIASETFRVAFDQRERYDARFPDARPWLYAIATNLLRMYFRRASRGKDAVARLGPDVQSDGIDDALSRVEARQLGPALAGALTTLSAIERDALLLHAWEGLTHAEIARALDLPVGTIRSRIYRARTAMRAHLAPSLQEPA